MSDPSETRPPEGPTILDIQRAGGIGYSAASRILDLFSTYGMELRASLAASEATKINVAEMIEAWRRERDAYLRQMQEAMAEADRCRRQLADSDARCEQLRGERDERAMDITQADANELQDILRTLTASGTALKTSARELVERWKALGTERDTLRAENAKYREALERYGDHGELCGSRLSSPRAGQIPCTCGFASALGNAHEASDAQP